MKLSAINNDKQLQILRLILELLLLYKKKSDSNV